MVAGYVFDAHWYVPYPRDEVAAVLLDLQQYPRWWPAVAAVASLGPDDALVLCRSRLPYTLELRLHAQERGPETLTTTIEGDLAGWARWRLAESPGGTELRYHQEVEVTGVVMRWASRIARPVLVWNHDTMMASCREGLTRRLRERPGQKADRAADGSA